MAANINTLQQLLENTGPDWNQFFHELRPHYQNIDELYREANTSDNVIGNKCLPLSRTIDAADDIRAMYYKEYLGRTNVTTENTVEVSSPSTQSESPEVVEIFLFYVFNDKPDLAEKALRMVKNPVLASLLTANIYETAAEKIMWTNRYIRQRYINTAERFSHIAAIFIDKNIHEEPNILHTTDPRWSQHPPSFLIEKSSCQQIHHSVVVRAYFYAQLYNGLDDRAHLIHLRVFIASLFMPLLLLPLMIPKLVPFRKDVVGFCNRVKCFYSIPLVQLNFYYISYVIFLIFYGYVVTTSFLPLNIYGEVRGSSASLKLTRTEIVIHIWMCQYVIEEILELIQWYRSRSLRLYLEYWWNILDVITTISYLIIFVVRFISFEAPFVFSKILLSINFILCCIRMLRLFTANKLLGSHLVLIFRMMQGLAVFFAFFLILIFGFSIAVEGLRVAPGQIHWIYGADGHLLAATVNEGGANEGYDVYDWYRIKRLFDWGIWKIVGQVDDVASNENKPYPIAIWCLSIIFVLLTNILLVSALIALFNEITENFKKNLTVVWRYEHFMLIKQWNGRDRLPSWLKRALFPPPSSVIWYAIYFFLSRWPEADLGAQRQAEFNMRQASHFYRQSVEEVVSDCMHTQQLISAQTSTVLQQPGRPDRRSRGIPLSPLTN